MSATIKRYAVEFSGNVVERANGDLVAYANHQASHRYNEKKERALFEAAHQRHVLTKLEGVDAYLNLYVEGLCQGWLACAKSRAKAAGCE